MYSRLIIAEYTGKCAALLFSYPVSKSKILTLISGVRLIVAVTVMAELSNKVNKMEVEC